MRAPLQNGSSGGGAASSTRGTKRIELGKVMAMVLAVASVGLATWVVIHYLTRPHPEGMDRITYWKCLNEGCGKEFSMTVREYVETIRKGPPEGIARELTLAELNAQSLCGLSLDSPLWCPYCGSYLIGRAHPCPHCGALVVVGPHGMLPDVCASCGRNPGRPPAEPLPVDEDAADGGS